MLYRFQTANSADILMLPEHARAVLGALGREAAPEGIFDSATAMRAAVASLDHAIEAEEAQGSEPSHGDTRPDAVSLRRRSWPLRDMLVRAIELDDVVTWRSR